jgi:hypothetical protein
VFVIALQTRRVEIAGIVRQPHGTWMLQVARSLVDADDGFLAGKRFLLLDRDPLYTTAFRELLRSAGITPIPDRLSSIGLGGSTGAGRGQNVPTAELIEN